MASLFTDQPGDTGMPGAERRLALLSMVLLTIMGVLDSSVVMVALPTIARELKTTEAASVWVVTAYQLAGAMSMLAFSALGGLVGFRRVFIGGVAVFAFSSLGCALAASLPWLVGLRFLQGVGAAAAMCVTPALFRLVFPLRLLGTVLGLNALVVATTTAASPTVGGLILGLVSWPWLFAMNVPLGALVGWLAFRALPRLASGTGRFDVAGALLSALAMGLFVLAVDQLAHPLAPHAGKILLGAALASGLAFVWRQKVAPHPLLPLQIFRSRRFSMATSTSILAFIGQGIAFIALPFQFQGTYGFTPLTSALLFTPWPLAIMLTAPLAGRLADRYGAQVLSSAGLLVLASGLVLLACLGPAPSVADILMRIFLCGLGYGFFQTPNNREFLSAAPDSMLGTASGMLNLSRSLGQTLGACLVSTVLAAYPPIAQATASQHPAAATICLWIAAVAVGAAAGASLLRAPRRGGAG